MDTRRSISASAAAVERDAIKVWITLDLSGGGGCLEVFNVCKKTLMCV